MTLVEQVKQTGVVGGGGGGFPTHVKLAAKADAAAKAAAVELLEIRLAMALGGKSFCTMTGDVASVQAAVSAGRQVITDAGVFVNAGVISRPHPDVYREVV